MRSLMKGKYTTTTLVLCLGALPWCFNVLPYCRGVLPWRPWRAAAVSDAVVSDAVLSDAVVSDAVVSEAQPDQSPVNYPLEHRPTCSKWHPTS